MEKILLEGREGGRFPEVEAGRENNWCEKYGYFIDLDACKARSYKRSVCRRCYKLLLQLPLPFEKI